MKLDIISESIRPLHPRCGFAFAGLACELPLAILELSKRCPDCGGKLDLHFFSNPADKFGSELIADAEYCDCGYSLIYADESKAVQHGIT